MRNAIVVLSVWLGCAFTCPAQTMSWADKLFEGNTTKDFGVVPHGSQLTYRFPLHNIYAVPLVITEVRASCTCVTATLSTKVLKPQETGYLNINMDGTRFNGPKSVNVYVTVGPEYISTAKLTVTANARADVVFTPGQLNFGTVPRGNSVVQTIDVEYTGTHDWRITDVVNAPNSPFEVSLRETHRQRPILRRSGKVGYTIQVTLKANAPDGPFRHEIGLKTNDQAQVLAVTAEGTIQAALTVSPSTINGESLKVGQVFTRKVFLRGRPFKVQSIDGIGDGVTVQFESDRSASTHFLTIQVQPQRVGNLQKQLVIHTDLDKESATVSLDVNVAP